MGTRWMGATAQVAGALALAGAMWGYGVGAASAAPDAAGNGTLAAAYAQGAPAHARRDVYGVVNLVPPPVFRAFINARSQVAFEYTALENSPSVGFFDGRRVIDAGLPGSLSSGLGALNDRGVLAAHTRPTIPETFLPYRWTAAGGLTFLPDPDPGADTFTTDINNRGQIVGGSQIVDRAVRWDAANRLVPLQLPPGYTQSFGGDINELNITAGAAAAADGNLHAVLWDAAGRMIDLGTFGATSAFSVALNNRNELAGTTMYLDSAGNQSFPGFLWNRRDGVAFVTPPGSNSFIAALNERNEAVGRLLSPDFTQNRAFYFSRKRGLVNLHRAPYVESSAGDINDEGTIVGSMIRANPDRSRTELAFRWSNFVPVNLNTRLVHVPAGLVLNQALGISATGDIVATSNAGLVLLRHGGAGSDEPVLGPLTLSEPLRSGVETRLTLTFSDRNVRDSHTATVDWGDGSGPQPASVRESDGRGKVSATHIYAAGGPFTIVVRVTDSTGKTTMTYRHVIVDLPMPDANGGHAARATGAGSDALVQRRAPWGAKLSPALQAWLNRPRTK